MGKAKPAHHTAKELNTKAFEATVNRGGGTVGMEDRKGGKAGHAKLKCPACGQQAPDPKSAGMHWESKHNKMGELDLEKWTNMHDLVGSTTQGVMVQGSKKK